MQIGVVMDPLPGIKPEKDTSIALLSEAQRQAHQLFYMTGHDLWWQGGIVWGRMQPVTFCLDQAVWYQCGEPQVQPLNELDCLLLRKDPPFDMEYLYLTYLLEQAQAQGVRVINDPQGVRDANEKLFAMWFPQCCPETLVTQDAQLIEAFVEQLERVVIKPLDGMGGDSVFVVSVDDKNRHVIIETMTQRSTRRVMVQKYIPSVREGDKRILMINGDPLSHALVRIPAADDFRGNLAAGARGVVKELTDRDYWICEQVGPALRDKGLFFVGLDIIGDYLTEVNVTSPTCLREIDAVVEADIAANFWLALQTLPTLSAVSALL